MPYIHISSDDRLKLEAWKETGMTHGEMARRLGRSSSSIGREFRRNGETQSNWYQGKKAEKLRLDRRRLANSFIHLKLTKNSELALFVEEKLKWHMSPEQIAGKLRRIKEKTQNKLLQTVSHERIYEWLYHERKDLIPLLRHSKKRRYRRKNGTKQREKRREEAKKNRIDTRPKEIEHRKRIGDYEGDTIVGAEKNIHILTHVDRKSRKLFADKLEKITAEETRKVTIQRFKKISKKKQFTITYDNGVQFDDHEMTSYKTGIKIFFAYPYHSWERGSNENANGLLREFFPKGTPFKDVTQKDIDRAVHFINTRPRKCLNYQTPDEVFYG